MSECESSKKYKEAEMLWKTHIKTGEPLTEEEVDLIVMAGLAKREDFDMRGGGLHWHAPTFPEKES